MSIQLISTGVTHLSMASSTVIHGESHLHMTDTAKIAVNIPLHSEGLGPLLLDIEYVGVATRAVEFGKMILMGKADVAAWRSSAKFNRRFEFIRKLHGETFCTD